MASILLNIYILNARNTHSFSNNPALKKKKKSKMAFIKLGVLCSLNRIDRRVEHFSVGLILHSLYVQNFPWCQWKYFICIAFRPESFLCKFLWMLMWRYHRFKAVNERGHITIISIYVEYTHISIKRKLKRQFNWIPYLKGKLTLEV